MIYEAERKAWLIIMKEKIRQIMIKGGFSVLIAVAAMSLYLAAMHFANKYFEKQTKPAEISVNDDGEIFIKGFEKEKDETIYILWETDAGNIKPVNKNEIFEDQYNNENNRGYCVNTDITDGVKWSGTDAAGGEYTAATVRAVIYSYDKNKNKDPYFMGSYVNELKITVTQKNGKISKADDERYFSNPVKAGNNSEWNEIYLVNEDSQGNQTYRYRTGGKIEEDMLILGWEADRDILSETDYEKGMYNCSIAEDNKNKNVILTKNTITVNKNEAYGAEISAYLTDEKTYNNYNDGKKEIPENKKLHKAAITVKK